MTRGQFGSASDRITNRGHDRMLSLGGQWKPSSRVQIAADLAYVRSDESMDRILFNVPAEVLAQLVDSIYDLTEAHTYSDLKLARWEAGLQATARLGRGVHGVMAYRLSKVTDDKPYLADLTGKLTVLQLGLRWTL